MKKILVSVLALVLTAAFLISCNKNSPKEVATNWLNCFWHMDYEGAKKLSTDDTKNFIAQLEQFSTVISDSSKKEMKKLVITVKDVKENGDKAVATYVMSDMPGKDQTLNLVKKNDRWLVQFTKNDKAGADMNMDGTGQDSTATMVPDTTYKATPNKD